MIRVAVVDDQALVRTGFRMVLEDSEDIRTVGEAGDGERAVALAAEMRPDVMILDVRMPGLDGVEAAKRICGAGLPTRVLMLTTFDLDEYVYAAVLAGASGFLLKDTLAADLRSAVRVVARGDAVVAPSVTRRFLEHHVRAAPPRADPVGLERLTEREREVLALVARALSNAEIAARLYLSEGTVKTHVSRVLGKLGLRDRVQAVMWAYENGVVRPGTS